jgi:quercetin dioxygenase-like cupin family protein
MNFEGNFRKIGEVDVAELAKLVGDFSEQDWDAAAYRQRRYEVHRDTQTIGLVFDEDFRHSHPTRLPALQKFEGPLRPALELIADYYEESEQGQQLIREFGYGYFVRASLVRLRAGGSIDAHTDNNFSLAHSHRVHIPIISNDRVSFTVGKESRVLSPGEVVEINNRRRHSVANDGATDRVHLILDFVLPGEMCCCGRLRHPDTLCSPVACRPTDYLEVPCECYPEP